MKILSIYALVSPAESDAVVEAAQRLTDALDSVQAGWRCLATAVDTSEDLNKCPDDGIRILSLLPHVYDLDQPWDDVSHHLMGQAARLAEHPAPLFICSVLRHAGRDGDVDTILRRRIRIRRLNLLAAELSRVHGAYVIDIDRALADIGAHMLGTDYRLTGMNARTIAADLMASTLAGNALDLFLPAEKHAGLMQALEVSRERSASRPEALPSNVMVLGQGRRRQRVATVIDTEAGNQVGRLVRQVLAGQMAPAAAMDKLVQAVRRRGALQSAALVFGAASRLLGGER